MPRAGMCWRHVVISTVNSWLPGDPRGFRALHHKIHSSGDHKNLPPPGEHQGLFHHSKRISGDAVVISHELRPIVGQAILGKLKKLDYRVLALAVAGMHAHMLLELPADLEMTRQVIGQCKIASSHAIRDGLPGRVWGRGGSFKQITDESHHRNTFDYILRQPDAWTWSFKEEQHCDLKPAGESSSLRGFTAPKPAGDSSSLRG